MPKMRLKKLSVVMTTVFALLAAPMAVTNANAGMAMNDKAILKAKQKLIEAMIDGTEAAVQKQIDLDKAAAISEDCTDLHERSKTEALNTVAAKKPSDPSKIIQNSTCFVDIAQFQIPIMVVSTGIGFIDQIIKSQLQKFLTSTCSASTNFLGDLTNTANAVFSGANLDTIGGMVFDYAAKDLPTAAELANAATATIDQNANAFLNTLVNSGAGSVKPIGTGIPANLQTQFDQIVGAAGTSLSSSAITTAQMYITSQSQLDAFQCSLGQKNATCP